MELINLEEKKIQELSKIKDILIRKEQSLSFFDEFKIGNVYVANKYSDTWEIFEVTNFDSDYIYGIYWDDFEDTNPKESKKSQTEFVEYYSKKYMVFNSFDEAKKEVVGENVDQIVSRIEELNMKSNGGSENGLVDLSSGIFYKSQINQLTTIKEETQSLFFKHRFQVDVMKNKLWHQQRHLESIISNLSNKLETFNRMISTIEAYQKAKDNIFQISSGKKSKRKTINLYKKILFADEEFGKPDCESIDIFNIDKFFDYLKLNYHELIDEKSVTMFRIRRKADKHYSDNPWVNAMENSSNLNTFLVFRNGDNIHILDTEEKYDELYPSDDFMIKINNEINEINESSRDIFDKENKTEKIKQKLIKEHKKLLMLESILINTDIFDDLTSDGKKVSLLNEKCIEENLISYVDYIDLVLNSENRPTFNLYLKNINNNIKHGSRIYLIRANSDRYEQRYMDKFEDKYNYNEWTRYTPHGVFANFYTDGELPKGAIGYIKIEIEYIKNKLKFFIYPHDTYINYDAVTVDDINYYLVDRFVRRNYMSYMEYLLCIEDRLREEKSEEERLISLMVNTLKKDGIDVSVGDVLEAVEWWKNKTNEFRHLLSDDDKAWRMITSRLKK